MNYEQKYKDALARARDLMTNQNPPAFDKHLIEIVLPELKESEDERIRKGLIKAVSGILKGNNLYRTDVTREEALAWLEKQGAKKRIFNADDWYVSEVDGKIHNAKFIEKQGGGKPTNKIEPKFKVGD